MLSGVVLPPLLELFPEITERLSFPLMLMCVRKLFPTDSELIYGLRGQEINSAHRLSWHFNYSQKTDCQSKLWQRRSFSAHLFNLSFDDFVFFFPRYCLVWWNNKETRKKQSRRNSWCQLGSLNDWSNSSWRTLNLLFRGEKTHTTMWQTSL